MKDLTKGNIYKTFLLFAIPMVLSWIADGAVGAGIYFFGSWRKALIQQSI